MTVTLDLGLAQQLLNIGSSLDLSLRETDLDKGLPMPSLLYTQTTVMIRVVQMVDCTNFDVAQWASLEEADAPLVILVNNDDEWTKAESLCNQAQDLGRRAQRMRWTELLRSTLKMDALLSTYDALLADANLPETTTSMPSHGITWIVDEHYTAGNRCLARIAEFITRMHEHPESICDGGIPLYIPVTAEELSRGSLESHVHYILSQNYGLYILRETLQKLCHEGIFVPIIHSFVHSSVSTMRAERDIFWLTDLAGSSGTVVVTTDIDFYGSIRPIVDHHRRRVQSARQ